MITEIAQDNFEVKSKLATLLALSAQYAAILNMRVNGVDFAAALNDVAAGLRGNIAESFNVVRRQA